MNSNSTRVHSLTGVRHPLVLITLGFTLGVLLFNAAVANAATVVRTGETVSLTTDQVVEGSFYGVGSTVAVSGEVTEDVVIIGGSTTLNGTVGSDVILVGGLVDIDGNISDDVRVAAGTVEVSGEIVGDLVVLAGELKVLSTAKIGGDILFFGTRGQIAGEVGRDVLGTSENLRIDGKVGGEINVKSGQLTLGDSAVVGNVRYTSFNDLVRGQNAVVNGEITKNRTAPPETFPVRELAIFYFVFLFAALAGYLFVRPFTERIAVTVTFHPVRSALIGLAALFALPLVSMVLLLSTLGILVGLVLLGLYLAVVAFAVAVAGAVLGYWLQRYRKNEGPLTLLWLLVGVTTVFALMLIPIVGQLAFITIFCLTLGAAIDQFYRSIQQSSQ